VILTATAAFTAHKTHHIGFLFHGKALEVNYAESLESGFEAL
jgi:hypothetical protein